MSLIDFFLENKQIQSWNEHLSLKQRQLLLGLSGSAKSLAIASSAKNQDKILNTLQNGELIFRLNTRDSSQKKSLTDQYL